MNGSVFDPRISSQMPTRIERGEMLTVLLLQLNAKDTKALSVKSGNTGNLEPRR